MVRMPRKAVATATGALIALSTLALISPGHASTAELEQTLSSTVFLTDDAQGDLRDNRFSRTLAELGHGYGSQVRHHFYFDEVGGEPYETAFPQSKPTVTASLPATSCSRSATCSAT